VKRVVIGIGIAVAILAALVIIGIHEEDETATVMFGSTTCVRDDRDLLTAQSVPGAVLVPCLTDKVGGWFIDAEEYSNEGTSFTLHNQTISDASWEMSFNATCQPDAAATTKDDRVGDVSTRGAILETPRSSSNDGGLVQTSWTTFPGGCVQTTVTTPGTIDRQLVLGETAGLLTLIPRAVLNAEVLHTTDGMYGL
jgi:hypothetical protein